MKFWILASWQDIRLRKDMSTNCSIFLKTWLKGLSLSKYSFPKDKQADTSARAVTLDIAKAFDMVWDAGLLHTLKFYGISGRVLFRLFSYFLSNRHLLVVVEGKYLLRCLDWLSFYSKLDRGSFPCFYCLDRLQENWRFVL